MFYLLDIHPKNHTAMQIQFKMNGNRGTFFIEEEGQQIAELDFQLKGTLMDAYHTGVHPQLEGQGIAGKLFDEMVRYAREHQYQVIPTCPYILAKFRKNPSEYADVWHHSEG